MRWHNVILVLKPRFFASDSHTILNPTIHQRLVLDFAKPLVSSFESRRVLESFHFFYEGDNLEIRLELDDSVTRNEVKNNVETHLVSVAGIIDKSSVNNFEPEVGDEQYGVDGWNVAKRIFEYGSRLAIALVDPQVAKGDLLRHGKLFHCVLNSCNYSKHGEMLFHIIQSIERKVLIMSQMYGVRPEDVNIEEAKKRVKAHMNALRIGLA